MSQINKELGFTVATVASTSNPQTVVYQGLHQCYSDSAVWDSQSPSEERCGEIAVERLLKGGRGHYSPLEHPQITFNCVGFPHSVVQQATRHRVGVAFSVQSFRYTWKKVYQLGVVLRDKKFDDPIYDLSVDDVFYMRKPGTYKSRDGSYEYTQNSWEINLEAVKQSTIAYQLSVEKGVPPEHARGIIPFDLRQNFVCSFNLRSLMHFLDMRAKLDAQLEIQILADMIFDEAINWCPQIMEWYKKHRYRKGRLAP